MRHFTIAENKSSYAELGAPLKVYYDITNRCNLNCVFCYKGNKSTDVKWESAKSIIRKVSDANIPDIVFIGGEPLCCSFLLDALRYAKNLGLNPGIVTNGTLFTRENVKELKPLVNNSISISVHAPNDELHDRISGGSETHTKIINGLKLLNENGIIPELSFTPIKENVPYLYDTIDGILSNGIQISDLLVNRLIPFGNALNNWKSIKIELSDQISLLEQMDNLQTKYPAITIKSGDALPFCVVEEKYWKYIARCDYAITLGWINDQNLFGKCMVRGCSNADSLDRRDLRELWTKSETFLCHRHMKNLFDECKNCEWLPECGGGCSCSGEGKTNKDVYLSASSINPMPPKKQLGDNSAFEVSVQELEKISDESIFTIRNRFTIRREHQKRDKEDCNYIFLPISSGAIITDTIIPENGSILWINEVEKQVIIYLQAALSVSAITRNISYEFNLPWEDAKLEVKATIAKLYSLGMVELK